MKLIKIIFTVLILSNLSCKNNSEKSEVSSIGEDNRLALFQVHEVELKPGVSSEEFEYFLLNDWIPPYDQLKGMNVYLTKGTRGVRNGKYAFIFTYDSIEDRNRIWPPSGETSPEIQAIRTREGRPAQYEKFKSMCEGHTVTFTDYEVIHRAGLEE